MAERLVCAGASAPADVGGRVGSDAADTAEDLAGVLAGQAGALERVRARRRDAVAHRRDCRAEEYTWIDHSLPSRRPITRRPSRKVVAKSWFVPIVEPTENASVAPRTARAGWDPTPPARPGPPSTAAV